MAGGGGRQLFGAPRELQVVDLLTASLRSLTLIKRPRSQPFRVRTLYESGIDSAWSVSRVIRMRYVDMVP